MNTKEIAFSKVQLFFFSVLSTDQSQFGRRKRSLASHAAGDAQAGLRLPPIAVPFGRPV